MRKQYGPLICAKTGKIDSETAAFIRPFVKRWKIRSIYQVLLQYRAARHMDLVQYMQQVHIYNQLLVTSLTKTSHCILMERIDPQQTNKELLGAPKMTVWKLPFRLDEIPYFDTSYLCDPDSIPKISGYDSDDEYETWDAPLHRRTTVSSKIATASNNARQGGGNAVGGGGRETPSLYHKPYSREPGQIPISRGSSPAPSDNFKPVLRPVSDRIGTEQYGVYKKRGQAPPPPPLDAYKAPSFEKTDTSSIKKRQAPRPPKIESDFDETSFEKRYAGSVAVEKPVFNPANELKKIAATSSTVARESSDENDPPFNFQGMLRKTQYNRASMKRDNSAMSVHSPIIQSPRPPNIIYTSATNEKKERPKSCLAMTKGADINQNEIGTGTTTGRKLSLQQDTLLRDVDLLNNNNNDLDEDEFTPETAENYIKEEIAPGVILEGIVDEV